MGLEALLSDSGSGSRRKFTQRVSRFFSYQGDNPVRLERIASEAYSIRSDFVHGVFRTKQPYESELVDTNMSVLDWLRRGVLFFLNHCDNITKKQIIELLDKAMIGVVEADESLRRMWETTR